MNILKGIIHFHSSYSYDSIVPIERIVNFALKENLNFLILTDHNTIKGSLSLKEYVEKNNLPIEVPIAAEYLTEWGDMIAVGIEREILEKNPIKFAEEVKKQNGIVLFPHPYKGHKNIEKLGELADLIEIYNGRTDDLMNAEAVELAFHFKKKGYYGSDAHCYFSLKNVIVEIEKNGDFLTSLIKSEIKPAILKKSFLGEITLSQLIKGIKLKDPGILYGQGKRLIKETITMRLLKKI